MLFLECPKLNMDIMFVLDGSSSIGNEDFKIVKAWVKNVTNAFTDTNGTIRFGVIQYSQFDATKSVNNISLSSITNVYAFRPINDQDNIIAEVVLDEYHPDEFAVIYLRLYSC